MDYNKFLVFLIVCSTIKSAIECTESTTIGTKVTMNFHSQVATTSEMPKTSSKPTRYEQGLEDYDEAQARQGRGMLMDDYSDHDYVAAHDHHEPEIKHEMDEQKAVKADPWAGYYDFIINEGSFKFWAVFQLVTAVLLIYSALAAVYYAKFNVITTDYDYYDDFFGRSNSEPATPTIGSYIWSGFTSQTFQRILDAISSKKFS